MFSTRKQLETLLDAFGKEIERGRRSILVTSTHCIDDHVPATPGVYWIETTMPAEHMREAICEVTGRKKQLRKYPPEGATLIRQRNQSKYVVYSGTEKDMRKRLRQHLFDEGHHNTDKLGCIIDRPQFSRYQWCVGYKEIQRYELRYAVEAWWRLNVGWPVFCIR